MQAMQAELAKKVALGAQVIERLKDRQKELEDTYQRLCEISRRLLPSISVAPTGENEEIQPPTDLFSDILYEIKLLQLLLSDFHRCQIELS